MNKFLLNALYDVAMFLLGVCSGIIIECTYSFHIAPRIRNNVIVFASGIIQLLVNALIINVTKEYIHNVGFFTLGLLSPQLLIIKKLLQDNLLK